MEGSVSNPLFGSDILKSSQTNQTNQPPDFLPPPLFFPSSPLFLLPSFTWQHDAALNPAVTSLDTNIKCKDVQWNGATYEDKYLLIYYWAKHNPKDSFKMLALLSKYL